ncbi:MAG: tetratricopeptide repeat protein, partial [Trichodesmium sp. ALOHA_ZT_67]|nr:tetratricopeptide repeat protein [Trichodesmium sp. ALOHA_ZT_67]
MENVLLFQEGEKVCSIVGLTGGGGVGKSALAYHFATVHRYEFPDGVIGLRVDKKDVNTIARQLARIIGHPIDEDDDIEAREIMQRFFAPRRMLLIFDNAEEAKIKVLRPGGNRCAIIVTTRKQNLPVSLDLSETATIRLRSLPENDALDLLRNILGQSEIDNALAAAKRIAEVVGRLPLALQVVGGTLRGKRRSLATYADSLQRQKEQLRLLPRLRLGEDPDFNVVACLNLSLECLQEEEIDFFACLGVCGEDGFALRTAMAAGGCEDEFDAEDFLDKLYEVSLLNSEEVQQDRFVLHPLVREYARSVAQDRNLLSLAQERHAQFFVERLQFDDLEDETVIAEVATDLSDVFLAAEWLQSYWGQTTESRKEAYEFVLKLQPLFEHYGYWEQGISLMERLQTWAEQFDDWSTVFQCQIHQGRYWSFVEEFERAEEILISAKDISSDDQKIEDIDTRRKRHAKVLNVLGGVYQKQGKTEKAIETFKAQIAIDESLDNKKSLAIVWNRLGNLLQSQNNLEEAQQAFEKGIDLAKSLDDKHGLAIGWNCLGGVLEKQGQFKEAQHAFETEIELAKSLDDKHGLAIGWNCLGGVLEKQG